MLYTANTRRSILFCEKCGLARLEGAVSEKEKTIMYAGLLLANLTNSANQAEFELALTYYATLIGGAWTSANQWITGGVVVVRTPEQWEAWKSSTIGMIDVSFQIGAMKNEVINLKETISCKKEFIKKCDSEGY